MADPNRTHLFLGQVDTASPPTSGAAELYVLSGGYGIAAGQSATLLVETPDIAPLGELGRGRARLLSCPMQYDAACTVRVTPIADYMRELDPLIVALAAPGVITRTTLQVKMARAVTVLRARIEVVEATGAVEFYTPTLYYAPLSARSGMAMGEEP